MKSKINRENYRKAEPTALKDAINQMYDAYNLKRKVDEGTIITYWEKIMGGLVAKRTTKLFFRDKKLIVELNSAPLKQELTLSKPKILELFAKEVGVGVVDEVVFL
jgi:predicted nucleic acid-binding Zn ribbon protein